MEQESESAIPAAVTDTGCERDLNEDRYLVVDSPSGLGWFVCDGMGGVAGGELAAQIAIEAIRRDLEVRPPRPPELALRNAIEESNRVIVLRRQNPAFAQMGTTCVGAVFSGPQVVIANIGDSRAYVVRDGAIRQLTRDHTYVQELVDSGKIKSDEALSHPQAHVLTRAIGAQPVAQVDTEKLWVWSGDSAGCDMLVLCTDGLYSLVTDEEIAQIVSRESPQQACVQLVELAKNRGGFDNITLAIIPLDGELREEAPDGTSEEVILRERLALHGIEVARENPVRYGQFLGVVVLLSMMAAVLTGLMTIFSIGS